MTSFLFTPEQQAALRTLRTPSSTSRKGQNGKLLIIGGSELFHAASAWSLTIAARIVDMVFYSSVPTNNELVKEAKKSFWDGVVIPRTELLGYVEEADCILIGPGMTRDVPGSLRHLQDWLNFPAGKVRWDENTEEAVNWLVARYPQKKWVVDAGALQMLNPELITESMILTPHHQEFERLFGVPFDQDVAIRKSLTSHNVTVLTKGVQDVLVQGSRSAYIAGGNAGMTKGGSGDVLAGLIAALYCTNDAWESALVGSTLNKLAADQLYQEKGIFFTTSELAEQLPQTMHQVVTIIHS